MYNFNNSKPISQLADGTVKATDLYPAVDTTDQTQAPTGTTKKYSIEDLSDYLANLDSTLVSVITSSTDNLNAIYNNGNNGVGATLTNAGAQIALVLDEISLSVGQRVLIQNQSDNIQNGIYIVTNIGSDTTNWVLTRSSDFDNHVANQIQQGQTVLVITGTDNGNTWWSLVSPGPYIIGSTPIIFDSININLVAGNNIAIDDKTISTIDWTAHGVMIAEGSSPVNPIVMTNGQLLIGNTFSDPTAAIPNNGNNISWTTGAGTLEANITGQIPVSLGGTGNNSLTEYGVIVGNGTSSVTVTSAGTNGQVFLGATSGNPAFATLGGSNGITYSTGTNSLNISNVNIPNSALANSSITVTAGTGLSGGGSVSLGSSTTLSLTNPVATNLGGSGVVSPTAHGVLIGEGSSPFNSVILGNHAILTGISSSDPIGYTLVAGHDTAIQYDDTLHTITIGGSGLESEFFQIANNLSEGVPLTMRTNLGLGTAAVQNVSYFAQTANNLSDLSNAGTARNNLGLGNMSTQNSGSVSISGGSINGTSIGSSSQSTGAFTSVDINGGTIDGTVIGGTTTAAGHFTTLSGTSATITGGTINGTTIGATTSAAGTFSTMTSSNVAITGETINNTPIGATTPNTGAFTTISASSFDINGGTIDNTPIGNTTRSTGKFTTLDANSTFTCSNVDINGGTIDNTIIGSSTASSATFTTTTTNGQVVVNTGRLVFNNNSLGDESIDIIFVGNTSGSTGGIVLSDGDTSNHQNQNILFNRYNGSVYNTVGNINYTQSATVYATSSDKRIKENIRYDFDSSIIDDINPAVFNFKNDENKENHIGFIAQELYKIYPHAVLKGDDDEEISIIIDKDGNKRQTGVWGVDPSKLVGLLIYEVKSLRKRVEQLEKNH